MTKILMDRWRVTCLLPIALKAFPQLRIGQLLDNALFEYNKENTPPQSGFECIGRGPAMFDAPDRCLADALAWYIRKHKTGVEQSLTRAVRNSS